MTYMRYIYDTFFINNFRYFPLIWIFCDKFCDSLVVRTHWRLLWRIYYTQLKPYEEVLDISAKNKIHTQNIQLLLVEVYKSQKHINASFTWNYFKHMV